MINYLTNMLAVISRMIMVMIIFIASIITITIILIINPGAAPPDSVWIVSGFEDKGFRVGFLVRSSSTAP